MIKILNEMQIQRKSSIRFEETDNSLNTKNTLRISNFQS